MKFVTASDSDKAYFEKLNELCYRDVVEKQFGFWDSDAQELNFDSKWRNQRFRKIIMDEQVIGGIWTDDYDEYNQLYEIQIHPTHQGNGIGTRIIKAEIDRAKGSGKKLRLRVLLENRAVSLYRKLGFVVVDETEVQYIMEHSG